jgi:hypothetical protein
MHSPNRLHFVPQFISAAYPKYHNCDHTVRRLAPFFVISRSCRNGQQWMFEKHPYRERGGERPRIVQEKKPALVDGFQTRLSRPPCSAWHQSCDTVADSWRLQHGIHETQRTGVGLACKKTMKSPMDSHGRPCRWMLYLVLGMQRKITPAFTLRHPPPLAEELVQVAFLDAAGDLYARFRVHSLVPFPKFEKQNDFAAHHTHSACHINDPIGAQRQKPPHQTEELLSYTFHNPSSSFPMQNPFTRWFSRKLMQRHKLKLTRR